MTDAAEAYKDMREQEKAKKSRRLHVANNVCGGGWTKVTEYYWTRNLAGRRMDYWPSGNRWRWKGKSYRGTPSAASEFVAKIEASQ